MPNFSSCFSILPLSILFDCSYSILLNSKAFSKSLSIFPETLSLLTWPCLSLLNSSRLSLSTSSSSQSVLPFPFLSTQSAERPESETSVLLLRKIGLWELLLCSCDSKGLTAVVTGDLQCPAIAFSAALSFKANSNCSSSLKENLCAPSSEMLGTGPVVVELVGGITGGKCDTSLNDKWKTS